MGEHGAAFGLLLQIEQPVEVAGRNHRRAAVRQAARAEHERAAVEAVFLEGVHARHPVAPVGNTAQLRFQGVLVRFAPLRELDERGRHLLVVQAALEPHAAATEDGPQAKPLGEVPIQRCAHAAGLVGGGHQFVVQRIGVVGIRWLVGLAQPEAVVWIEDLHRVGRDALLRTRHVARQQQIQRLRWLPAQREAGEPLEDLADRGLRIGDAERFAHAVAGLHAAGHGHRQRFADGRVGKEVAVQASQAASLEIDASTPVPHGLSRDDVQRAAEGVAPRERALGPAQHLHPLDVQQVHVGAHVAPQVDAVHVDAHGRIGGDDVVLQADAAHEHRGVAGIALAEVRLHHVRRELLQLVEFGDAPRPDRVFVERRDGRRHIEERFLPPTGRHHQLLDGRLDACARWFAKGRGSPRERGQGASRWEECEGRDGGNAETLHRLPPATRRARQFSTARRIAVGIDTNAASHFHSRIPWWREANHRDHNP